MTVACISDHNSITNAHDSRPARTETIDHVTIGARLNNTASFHALIDDITTFFSRRTLNTMLMEDSHKIFAIRQEMEVDLRSAWAKSGSVESKW